MTIESTPVLGPLCVLEAGALLKQKARYQVNVGITYPPSRCAVPGDIVDDVPGGDIKRLLAEGTITRVSGDAAPEEEDNT